MIIVEQIYSTGDFVLNTGDVRFTIMMSPTTAVLNVRGRQVPRQFIAVAGPVEVTGTVAGTKLFMLYVTENPASGGVRETEHGVLQPGPSEV